MTRKPTHEERKQELIRVLKNIAPAEFSDEGLEALAEHCLTQYEDPVRSAFDICADYTEYELFEDFNDFYDGNYHNLDEVRKETTVVLVDGGPGFIAREF